MAHIIVETTYDKPPSDADLTAGGVKLAPCLEKPDGRWIRSYLSTDRRRRICEFEAPDAESVREAFAAAGIACDVVWTAAAVVKIEDHPDFLQKRDAVRARLRGK